MSTENAAHKRVRLIAEVRGILPADEYEKWFLNLFDRNGRPKSSATIVKIAESKLEELRSDQWTTNN